MIQSFHETQWWFRGSTNLRVRITLIFVFTTLCLLAAAGCQTIMERRDVRPLVLRDVPAQRLAFRFEPDIGMPTELKLDESDEKLAVIQTDFSTRRPDDALLRTVLSPDGQRALALYGTESEPSPNFRLDLYAADGRFLRNLTPPELSCVFPETVAWSGDGNLIAFIAHRSAKPAATPTPPPGVALPEPIPDEAQPAPTVAPTFAPVATFATEQIYVCNRDGYDLRPLTTREGLIYFYFAWAPDGHAFVALACREPEWAEREKAYKLPAGRPRLVTLDGQERLLDDELTECLPAWSPDSAKVITAFDVDVGVFDAATNKPTQARIRLRDALIAASFAYEKTISKKDNGKTDSSQSSGPPPSFNSVVRVEWPSPEKVYLQTAYIRVYPSETVNTFQRWHRLILSPQAAVLK
ncbi:MAG: TolB family protein [Pyrinomonadaceae bacterium]